MGAHIKANGEFQSDKYPTCPPGKVPLSVKDPTAQDLLWEYAQRRRGVDAEFSEDLEKALRGAGFEPPHRLHNVNELRREALDLRYLLAEVGRMGRHGFGLVLFPARPFAAWWERVQKALAR